MAKLQVMNRTQIETLSAKRFKPHTMVISISDYDDKGAKITHFPEFFTKMCFDDVDATERDYHPLDTYQANRICAILFSM